MKRILITVFVAALVLVEPITAWAAYTLAGNGHGASGATAVASQSAPTVVKSGSSAVVSWPAGSLATGQTATGYVVRRTVGTSTSTVCTTQSPTRTCTDTAPAAGTATYQVASVFASWTGPFSPATTYAADVTAPSTTATSNPAPNAAGWNKAAPTLTFTASDDVAVASVTYRVGTATPVTVSGSTAAVQVTAPGTTSVTYYATDSSGNVEGTKTYTVRLDTVAPATTSGVTGSTTGGYHTSPPTVSLTATDASSGVSSVTYAVNGGTATTVSGASASFVMSTQGTNTVTFFATDVAGNAEVTKTITVKLDSVLPTLVVDDPNQSYSLKNTSRADSWAHTCSDDPGVCGTASDTGSGLATVTFALGNGSKCWNGTDFVTAATCSSVTLPVTSGAWHGSIPFAKMIAGSFTLTVKATDNAGQVTTVTRSFTVTS